MGSLLSQGRHGRVGARVNEATIVKELNASQGRPVSIGGYYHPDETLTTKAMRPSASLNAILDPIR